jgi:hypothetical protein
MPSTAYKLFRRAILEEKQVICLYDGRHRELCPHIIGHSAGTEKVLAYQFAGESSGRLPQWRCLFLDKVADVRLRDGRWYEGGEHRSTQTCVTDIELDINVHVRKARKASVAAGRGGKRR